MTMSRVEVITSKERRRRWSLEEKRQLVAASLEPGASMSEVARSAGIHVSQLFRWRKDLCERSAVKVAAVDSGRGSAASGGGVRGR
jgi:transposase